MMLRGGRSRMRKRAAMLREKREAGSRGGRRIRSSPRRRSAVNTS